MGIFDDVLNSAKTGNFDDVLLKTKAYAEDAAKKSAERLEISKKKIELLDSKTKLVKAYEKYGKLQYDLYEGLDVSQDELDACIDEIQLQRNRNEILDSEIEELKKLFVESLSKKEPKHNEKGTVSVENMPEENNSNDENNNAKADEVETTINATE